MDTRVTDLIEDMRAGRISHPDGSLDSETLEARIVQLHEQVEDEESKVELIRLHNALMSSSEKRLIEQGSDPTAFRRYWREQHLSFMLKESLTADGEVDEEKLARINAREVAAGRLAPNEAVHILKDGPAPSEPRGTEPTVEQPADSGANGQSELELAYRGLFRWEDERMRPRIEALAEDFRNRLQQIEPQSPESFRSAAEQETLEIARWFEDNYEAFLGEAVSYVDDDVLKGLQEQGVDRQFGNVILGAIDEARDNLRRRMHEIREIAYEERGVA